MKEIKRGFLTGERALYAEQNAHIIDSIFCDGESPLKEAKHIELEGCMFKWKYPLWYCQDIKVKNCTWFEMGRSGVWYTRHMTVEDSMIEAPKNFRRCQDVTLNNVSFANAAETFWSCDGVKLNQVVARGDYFGMNSRNIYADGLNLYGNYCFDGAQNVEIHNSKLMSKDAFWNCENVVVYDSCIYGEYLAWNSKNVTFVNCTIESEQGLCYIENLKMVNCQLVNTTLAFEYADVEAQISGRIESVFNPTSGSITADAIGELILEKDLVDPSKTRITCRSVDKQSDKPDWK